MHIPEQRENAETPPSAEAADAANDTSSPSSVSRKQRGMLIAKAIVSVGILAFLILRLDFEQALQSLKSVPLTSLFCACLLMTLTQLACAYRLWILLTAQEINTRLSTVIRLTFIGLFAGNFLPGTVGGDFVKGLILTARGNGRTAVASCLIIDRLTNLAAICLLMPLVYFGSSKWFDHVSAFRPSNATVRLVLVTAVILLPLSLYVFYAATIRWARALLPKTSSRPLIRRLLSSFVLVGEQWSKSHGTILTAVLVSWFSIFLHFFAVWLLAQGMHIDVAFLELSAILIAIYIVTLIPISLNGLGVREFSLVYLLSIQGIGEESAFALALLSRLVYFAVSLLGSCAWLTSARRLQLGRAELLSHRGGIRQ